MPLSLHQQQDLARASRASIEREFAHLPTYWAASSWLTTHNRYRQHCIKRLEKDLGPPRKLRAAQLREYIAASTVLHCMDGWAYLGRALLSYLSGDIDVARHLAYYSELRATMALLGTEGIGVFDRRHISVASNDRCVPVRGSRGTHAFAWEALEDWTQQSQSLGLIRAVIVAGGQPLGDWLDQYVAPPAMSGLLTRDWFRRWGLDLQRLSMDRDARNLVSYRPTQFTSVRPSSARTAVAFVRHLWEMCEPILSMRFRRLDRHLLRHSLDFIFSHAHSNRSRKQAKRIYAQRVDNMIKQVGPGDLSEVQWRAFVTFEDEPSHPQLIREANATAKPTEPGQERQVLSRATLLLRIATGACELLIGKIPGFASTGIHFWWGHLGEDRTLWDVTSEPAQMIDLWTDVEQALSTLENWEVGAPGAYSYWRLWQEQATSAAVLGTCERIGLWGLGL